jgi:hypothetical protein
VEPSPDGDRRLLFGLLGDAVILGLTALPGLEGWRIVVLLVPFFFIGWVTIIGLGMTVVALLADRGRPRIVGATFVAAPVALFLVNVFANGPSGDEGPTGLIAIAFAVVAGSALLMGFVGLGLLAIGLPRSESTRQAADTR